MKNSGILLFLILFYFCFNQDYLSSDSNDPSPYTDFTNYYFSDSNDPNQYYFSDYIDDSTKQNNSTVIEPKPRIILIGFENYQISQNIIFFNVIFRRIYGNIFPKYLTITVHIIYEKLRNLDEVSDLKCPKITEDNEDNMKFSCSVKTTSNNIIKVYADKNYKLLDENGNTYEDLQTFLTGYANRTIGNIQNQKEQIKEFIILQNSTKAESDKQFDVMGNISENETIKDNTEVSLYFEENESVKEIPCIIKKDENHFQYELECTPQQTIAFHLDNVDGTISNKTLIISMRDGEDDFVNITIPNNPNNSILKKSSKGLSAGAITGIAIACVLAAIISVIIAILLCRKSPKPPMQNNITQIDIYSNASKTSQQNI